MSHRARRGWSASLAGRGRWWSRPVWAVLASASIWTLVLSRLLTPAPEGVGTHTQLGLAPCAFLALTGHPCPSCGLTTCFAHMMRFELLDAFAANGGGVPLFLVCVTLLPLSLYGLARDLPVLDALASLRGDLVLAAVVAAFFAGWVVELLASTLR